MGYKPIQFVALLCLISLGLAGCQNEEQVSALPFFSQDDLTPMWMAEASLDEAPLRQVGAFSFTDQTGSEISDATMRGQIYVTSFFFVECKDICPTLRTRLTAVQEAFEAHEVAILSHSVIPESDSVEKLAAYSKVNHIDDAQWHLLTGDKSAIYEMATSRYGVQLARQTGAASIETDFLHTETFFLVDGYGYIRGLYNGSLPLEVQRLVEDAQMLLDERA